MRWSLAIFVSLTWAAPRPALAFVPQLWHAHDSQPVEIPSNGRILLESEIGPYAGTCRFWMLAGDSRIPLLATETHDRSASRIVVLHPTRRPATSDYRVQYDCDGRRETLLDKEGSPVELRVREDEDHWSPEWAAAPRLVTRRSAQSYCRSSIDEVSAEVAISDSSGIWMNATIWAEDAAPTRHFLPIANGAVVLASAHDWQARLSPGKRYSAILCAIDAAGNERCAPEPPLTFLAPTACDPFRHLIPATERQHDAKLRAIAVSAIWLVYLVVYRNVRRRRRRGRLGRLG